MNAISKIEITRNPSNVRFGSRAWAARQKDWTYAVNSYMDGAQLVLNIYAGKTYVAAIELSDDMAVAEWAKTNSDYQANYGACKIGDALYGDLVAWAETLDLSGDDKGALTITTNTGA